MASSLSAVTPAKRKQLAATLGLFATLFVAVGAVASTGAVTATLQVFVGVAFGVALLLALMAWGVLASVRGEIAERELDSTIERAVTASGRQMCDCGHEHDPDELHITDAEPDPTAISTRTAESATNAQQDGTALPSCRDGAHEDPCAKICRTCMHRPSPRPTPHGRVSVPAGSVGRPRPGIDSA